MADTPQQPVSREDLRRKFLTVHIASPDHLVFDGSAKALSTTNDKGPLDILPAHENFISIVKEKIVIYDASNKAKEIKIDSAVLHVNANKVDVFVGIPQIELKNTPVKNKLFNVLQGGKSPAQ